MTEPKTASFASNIRYTNALVRQANFDADLMKVYKRLAVRWQEQGMRVTYRAYSIDPNVQFKVVPAGTVI